jgi:arylsulfatase A-like enzyme
VNHHEKTRRDFLKTVGAGAAALAMPTCATAGKAPKKRPNILFLFSDDQRFDTINALGNSRIVTPNMDSLVRSGTTFLNAYIMGSMSGAVCMPSRAMLMSGRTLFHLSRGGSDIPPVHVTLPEVLGDAGYNTFATGKWHNGRKAYARCFSDGGKIFFGGMSDHYKVPVYDFDPEGKYRKSKQYADEGKHSSELFSDAVIDFLSGYKDDAPFFAYVAYTAPHDPRHMPEKYMDMYDPDAIRLPKNFLPEHPFDNGEMVIRDEKLAAWPRTPEEVRQHIAAYYAMITHLDAQIGRVLDALKETGHADDTIVVFSADNGLAVGRHGLMGKQNLYEHSVHVPLVICGPGIPRNKRQEALCYLPDIYPTLCDLVGLTVPDSVEGMSLWPVLRGEREKTRDALLFAYKNFQRGLRIGGWKLIMYNVNGNKTTQLFNIWNDPWEMNNLAEEIAYAGTVGDLIPLMKHFCEEAGDKIDLDKPDWGVAAAAPKP